MTERVAMSEKEKFRAEFAKRLADAKAKVPATLSIPGVGRSIRAT